MSLPATDSGRRRASLSRAAYASKHTLGRRWLSSALAALNRGLDAFPFTHWLHRRVRDHLEMPSLSCPLRSGAQGPDGLRLAFVTDVHAGSFLDAVDLAEIFRRVQQSSPDLVLFGGDLVNTREQEIELFADGLRELAPRYGVYAVPGNHDHYYGEDISRWKAFLEDRGVAVLDNRGVRVEHAGGSLWLCGVDDLTEGVPDLRAALDGRRPGETTLLLSHHPDFFFEASAAGVDLQLSGHTHGGQIRVGGKAPLHHSRLGYEQGWFREGQSKLYVSRGVGVTLVPIRVGAPPEVPVFTLRSPAGERSSASVACRAGELVGAPD